MKLFNWDFRKAIVDRKLNASVTYCVDELIICDDSIRLAGWLFHPTFELEYLALRDNMGNCHHLKWLPGPDVALQHGPKAAQSRFKEIIPLTFRPDASACFLEAKIMGNKRFVQVPLLVITDPYHRLFGDFIMDVNAMPKPSVLELGSRARSGNVYSGVFNNHVCYKGLDIASGVNVDVVGDAHKMSQLFPTDEKFDAIFSISVFEHLAVPWKVVLECNKILKPSGIIFIASHQTWPVHDAPWDFWRFSNSAWQALFNEATGFRVVEAVMGLPCSVRPISLSENQLMSLSEQPAFLGTAVIAQKIGETELEWPVDINTVVDGLYPG